MLHGRFPWQLILIFVIIFIILFINLYFGSDHIPHSCRILRFETQTSINNFKDIDQTFVFFSHVGYWNFTLNSFIHINLEADITPNIDYFIEKNKNDFENNSNSYLFEYENKDKWKSLTSVGIQIQSSINKSLLLLISEIWYTKNSSHQQICNSDISYLYIEGLTSNYIRTSYNWSINNRNIFDIPSILQSNINQSCFERFHPHTIINQKNQWTFYFNTIDTNQQRKIKIYDLFNNDQISLTLKNELLLNNTMTWTSFIKNDKLYLISSYNPLNILYCSQKDYKCEILSNIENNEYLNILEDKTTQLIQFQDTDYFVGIISIISSTIDCGNISRPHIIILSIILNKFRLIYISEPLEFDNISIFSPLSMSEEKNSTDFCYGIIRQIIPQSIFKWELLYDKLFFTLSINNKKTYIVNINGIGKIVQNLINIIQKNNSYINLFNIKTDEKIIFYTKNNALHYTENLIRINQIKYTNIFLEKQILQKTYLKDIIDSPTYPTYKIISNTNGINLKLWIEYDYINYGLIGRYLIEYNNNNQLKMNNNLMIDAGGNHGMYAFYGAMFNQTVHIFEILPKYWIVIEESIKINKNFEKKIFLHKYGVSDKYNIWNILPDDGTTRLLFKNTNNLTSIETYPLDDFIFQKISFMKIDVESFEIRVLKGAFKAIEFFRIGAILIEIASYRWIWNNITIDQGISTLEYVTSIGHYSNYIILRNDINCPLVNISNLNNLIEIKNLTMINMKNGQLEIAPQIYQFNHWKDIIIPMKNNDWSCNFWLETYL